MLTHSAVPPFPSRPTLLGPAGDPKCLYFSCFSKKSTQKKARKGGHPLFQPPRLSRVRTIQPRRPKPAYSGPPAPATAPRSDVAVWLGPQNAPSRYCWGRPHVGADALIGPFLRPARRRFPREIHPIRGPAGSSSQTPVRSVRLFGEHPLPFVARPPPTETAVSVGKGAAAK